MHPCDAAACSLAPKTVIAACLVRFALNVEWQVTLRVSVGISMSSISVSVTLYYVSVSRFHGVHMMQ